MNKQDQAIINELFGRDLRTPRRKALDEIELHETLRFMNHEATQRSWMRMQRSWMRMQWNRY